MDSLSFLEKAGKARPLPLYVVHGDEDFLKRQVMHALRRLVLGAEDDDLGPSVHAGDQALFDAVHDELQTAPFFSARRLVIVENADPFVTCYREALERAIPGLPASSTLVLEVKSWPANTRLAQLIDASATIVCKAPQPFRLPAWCIHRSQAEYGKQLAAPAAGMLVDLVGPDLGQLDQELQKLVIYVGTRSSIEPKDVDRLVGRSHTENIWKILDAIGAGQLAQALKLLDRLLDQAEEPLRILGAFSVHLRRLAQVARLNQQGLSLPAAIQQAGVQPYQARGIEQQLRHLGRRRAGHLYDWLLETNRGLKGSSPLSARTLLERLVVRLARSRS
jgi:DNA polymerase-3 subunit delta